LITWSGRGRLALRHRDGVANRKESKQRWTQKAGGHHLDLYLTLRPAARDLVQVNWARQPHRISTNWVVRESILGFYEDRFSWKYERQLDKKGAQIFLVSVSRRSLARALQNSMICFRVNKVMKRNPLCVMPIVVCISLIAAGSISSPSQCLWLKLMAASACWTSFWRSVTLRWLKCLHVLYRGPGMATMIMTAQELGR